MHQGDDVNVRYDEPRHGWGRRGHGIGKTYLYQAIRDGELPARKRPGSAGEVPAAMRGCGSVDRRDGRTVRRGDMSERHTSGVTSVRVVRLRVPV